MFALQLGAEGRAVIVAALLFLASTPRADEVHIVDQPVPVVIQPAQLKPATESVAKPKIEAVEHVVIRDLTGYSYDYTPDHQGHAHIGGLR